MRPSRFREGGLKTCEVFFAADERSMVVGLKGERLSDRQRYGVRRTPQRRARYSGLPGRNREAVVSFVEKIRKGEIVEAWRVRLELDCQRNWLRNGPLGYS